MHAFISIAVNGGRDSHTSIAAVQQSCYFPLRSSSKKSRSGSRSTSTTPARRETLKISHRWPGQGTGCGGSGSKSRPRPIFSMPNVLQVFETTATPIAMQIIYFWRCPKNFNFGSSYRRKPSSMYRTGALLTAWIVAHLHGTHTCTTQLRITRTPLPVRLVVPVSVCSWTAHACSSQDESRTRHVLHRRGDRNKCRSLLPLRTACWDRRCLQLVWPGIRHQSPCQQPRR